MLSCGTQINKERSSAYRIQDHRLQRRFISIHFERLLGCGNEDKHIIAAHRIKISDHLPDVLARHLLGRLQLLKPLTIGFLEPVADVEKLFRISVRAAGECPRPKD